MKSIFLLVLIACSAPTPALAQKRLERAPASGQCITAYKDCVTEKDLEKRGRYCEESVRACQSRFNEEQEAKFRELDKRCATVANSARANAKPAAEYCRAALTQYLLFN